MSPQLNYTPPTQGLPGQLAGTPPGNVDSALYPRQAQVSTITVSDFDNGTYTIRITSPDGSFVDVSFVAVGLTVAQITAGLRAAVNAELALSGIVSAVDTATTVVLTFVEFAALYGVSFPSNPGPGNMVAALTVDPNRATLPIGIGAVSLSGGTVRQPTAGDLAAAIDGFVIRNDAEINPRGGLIDNAEGYAAGSAVPMAKDGDYWCDVEGAVTYNGAVFCRVVATGAEVAGALRADADGGDAVAINAIFRRATTGAGRSIVRLLGLP